MSEQLQFTTNIRDAIDAINEKRVDPVLFSKEYIYLFSTSDVELGNIIYTRYDAVKKKAIDAYSVRYGSYHNLFQILFNPLPKGPYEILYKTVDEFIKNNNPVTPAIILGQYKR